MFIKVETNLEKKFPGLNALMKKIRGIEVKKKLPALEDFKLEVLQRSQERWTLDELREDKTIRAYRNFFWRIGVDPTKIRPASEALLRRVLRGRSLPLINTFVDAYNLASIETAIPIAAFDEDQLSGPLVMRMAKKREEFLGIGMEKPIILNNNEAVIDDSEKLIAIYPYRDAEACKITRETKNALMLICGVPNIQESTLEKASNIAVEYVTKFCGGKEAKVLLY